MNEADDYMLHAQYMNKDYDSQYRYVICALYEQDDETRLNACSSHKVLSHSTIML
jgi:hypothetical protein